MVGEIAATYPGLGDPRSLRGDSVFLWYLQAKARSAQELDQMVRAVCTPYLDAPDYKAFRHNLAMLAAGPGRLVTWEDTLTEKQKRGLKRAREAQQRTIEKLKRHGLIGDKLPKADEAGRAVGKRFGRVQKPGANSS